MKPMLTITNKGKYPELKTFIDSLDVKKTTAAGYEKKVRDFLSWATENHVIQPKPQDVRNYRTALTDRGLSPYSVSAYLTAVRRFFSWAEGEGIYPNVAREIKGAKTRRGHAKDALTAAQVKKVMKSAKGERTRALLALLFTTGVRTVEIIRADVGDLRTMGDKTVLNVWGKGRDSADDFVVVPAKAAEAAYSYLSTRGPLKDGDPLFTGEGNRNYGGRLTTRTIRRIVKEVFQGAGVSSSKITAHSTRHTAVTLALKAGASIQEVQALARHASIATTQGYAHNIEKLESGTSDRIAKAIF
jgi:site-specific recombinase XerD